MAGKKIEQARKALKSVLNNLRDEDLFNIVAYDDRVESFKPELQRYGSRAREEAERFVDNIREGGSTNIDSALKTALAMIQDSSRPSYVLFLTDGLPTAGETRELSIAENCRSANAAAIADLLLRRRLRRQRPLARSAERRQQRHQRIRQARRRHRDARRELLLQDDEAGAFRHSRRAGGDRRQPDLPARRSRPVRRRPDRLGGPLSPVGPDDDPRDRQGGRRAAQPRVPRRARRLARAAAAHDFVERLWAVRRLGDLIDQIDLHGQNRELVDELVSLSTKYGILTPYTSFLADERVTLHASDCQCRRSRATRCMELQQVTGRAGVAQRRFKQDLMRADRAAAADLLRGFAQDYSARRRLAHRA